MSHKKWNLATCNNLNGPWVCCAKWNRSDKNTVWFHLYMCSNNSQLIDTESWLGFPHSSVSKESACNAGDHGSIPGSGRSPGEGNGSPL